MHQARAPPPPPILETPATPYLGPRLAESYVQLKNYFQASEKFERQNVATYARSTSSTTSTPVMTSSPTGRASLALPGTGVAISPVAIAGVVPTVASVRNLPPPQTASTIVAKEFKVESVVTSTRSATPTAAVVSDFIPAASIVPATAKVSSTFKRGREEEVGTISAGVTEGEELVNAKKGKVNPSSSMGAPQTIAARRFGSDGANSVASPIATTPAPFSTARPRPSTPVATTQSAPAPPPPPSPFQTTSSRPFTPVVHRPPQYPSSAQPQPPLPPPPPQQFATAPAQQQPAPNQYQNQYQAQASPGNQYSQLSVQQQALIRQRQAAGMVAQQQQTLMAQQHLAQQRHQQEMEQARRTPSISVVERASASPRMSNAMIPPPPVSSSTTNAPARPMSAIGQQQPSSMPPSMYSQQQHVPSSTPLAGYPDQQQQQRQLNQIAQEARNAQEQYNSLQAILVSPTFGSLPEELQNQLQSNAQQHLSQMNAANAALNRLQNSAAGGGGGGAGMMSPQVQHAPSPRTRAPSYNQSPQMQHSQIKPRTGSYAGSQAGSVAAGSPPMSSNVPEASGSGAFLREQ